MQLCACIRYKDTYHFHTQYETRFCITHISATGRHQVELTLSWKLWEDHTVTTAVALCLKHRRIQTHATTWWLYKKLACHGQIAPTSWEYVPAPCGSIYVYVCDKELSHRSGLGLGFWAIDVKSPTNLVKFHHLSIWLQPSWRLPGHSPGSRLCAWLQMSLYSNSTRSMLTHSNMC